MAEQRSTSRGVTPRSKSKDKPKSSGQFATKGSRSSGKAYGKPQGKPGYSSTGEKSSVISKPLGQSGKGPQGAFKVKKPKTLEQIYLGTPPKEGYSRIKPEQKRKKIKSWRPRTKPEETEAPKPKFNDGKIRLNKYLADCGVTSRRKADELIGSGAITINGRKVFELGIKVDPKSDKILFNGKPLVAQTNFVYYVFNKPKSVVTSTVDPQGRRTVIDYFGKTKHRLFPVGRLDWDTEGLLLVTNDGEFAQKVIHPDADVPKTYHAKLDGIPNDASLEKLRKGVSIIGGKVAANHVKKLTRGTETKSWVEITISEGKNHQIKQMFAKIGFDVIKLRRVAIGELWINPSLKSGDFRELTYNDLKRIFKKRPAKRIQGPKDDDKAVKADKLDDEGDETPEYDYGD